jgi:starch phosphorylase
LSVLEQDIVPQFYERGRDSLPRGWITKIKNSIAAHAPFFNTRRMVKEYAEKYYLPEFVRGYEMTHPNLNKGLAFAAWRSGIEQAWKLIRVQKVDTASGEIKVDEEIEVRATIALGQLQPEDVSVQVFYGPLNTSGEIIDGTALEMKHVKTSKGEYQYTAKLRYTNSGQRGISVRVVPKHEYLPTPFLPKLITWA